MDHNWTRQISRASGARFSFAWIVIYSLSLITSGLVYIWEFCLKFVYTASSLVYSLLFTFFTFFSWLTFQCQVQYKVKFYHSLLAIFLHFTNVFMEILFIGIAYNLITFYLLIALCSLLFTFVYFTYRYYIFSNYDFSVMLAYFEPV